MLTYYQGLTENLSSPGLGQMVEFTKDNIKFHLQFLFPAVLIEIQKLL